MASKPSDIVEQLNQIVPIFNPASPGTSSPPWFNGSPIMWQELLCAAASEIRKLRADIADLNVMKESYSKLYKQIYGND